MRTKCIFVLLLPFLFSCESSVDVPEIVPTAFHEIESGERGVTVQEMSDHTQFQLERVKRNTVNHKLPIIHVLNSKDEVVVLNELIEKPTLILVMDSDCGIGQMYARENLPMALNRSSVDRSRFDVIFLVSTYRKQTFESDEVLAFRKDIEAIYPQVCLISEENANKMNATGVSTLLVDDAGVVRHYRKGSALNSDDTIIIFDYMLSLIGIGPARVNH